MRSNPLLPGCRHCPQPTRLQGNHRDSVSDSGIWLSLACRCREKTRLLLHHSAHGETGGYHCRRRNRHIPPYPDTPYSASTVLRDEGQSHTQPDPVRHFVDPVWRMACRRSIPSPVSPTTKQHPDFSLTVLSFILLFVRPSRDKS